MRLLFFLDTSQTFDLYFSNILINLTLNRSIFGTQLIGMVLDTMELNWKTSATPQKVLKGELKKIYYYIIFLAFFHGF